MKAVSEHHTNKIIMRSSNLISPYTEFEGSLISKRVSLPEKLHNISNTTTRAETNVVHMNTLRILTQQDSIGLWEELVENTLEEIAVEGVGQNTLKQTGGVGPDIRKTQSNYCNVFSAFLTSSLHCILDQLPPLYS